MQGWSRQRVIISLVAQLIVLLCCGVNLTKEI